MPTQNLDPHIHLVPSYGGTSFYLFCAHCGGDEFFLLTDPLGKSIPLFANTHTACEPKPDHTACEPKPDHNGE